MNPLLATEAPKALLALEDGTTFEGLSVGATGETFGELVFNTAMSGYQEVISDPSYAGQVVTFTYPQIGNYGVCPEALDGAPIALIEDGDILHVDLTKNLIEVEVSEDEFARRKQDWKPIIHENGGNLLARYAKQVGSAKTGAVLA